MNYIIDHNLISGDIKYIVFAIGQRTDKSTYLYEPQVLIGWAFKQLIEGCYAAIPMPEWNEDHFK